jgi:3-oxoacyl-[acyl-carrier-protein] synthase II
MTCHQNDPQIAVMKARPEGVEKKANPRALRRLDPFSQRALYAALLAIEDSGLGLVAPERVGVLFATGHGPVGTTFAFLDETIDHGDGLGSPITFANSVHGAAAAAISSTVGLRGPMLSVTGSFAPWAQAIDLAIDWLERGQAERVLLVSGDEFHPVAGWGIRRLGGGDSERVQVLDFERCTLVAGETFTAFLLGRCGAVDAKHGLLGEPVLFGGALPAGDEVPLFLSACGDRREGAGYLSVARGAKAVAAYGSIWGANPTAEAMTAMTAALSLGDGRFYEVPEAASASAGIAVLKAGPIGDRRAVRCVSMDSRGSGVLVRVEK